MDESQSQKPRDGVQRTYFQETKIPLRFRARPVCRPHQEIDVVAILCLTELQGLKPLQSMQIVRPPCARICLPSQGRVIALFGEATFSYALVVAYFSSSSIQCVSSVEEVYSG